MDQDVRKEETIGKEDRKQKESEDGKGSERGGEREHTAEVMSWHVPQWGMKKHLAQVLKTGCFSLVTVILRVINNSCGRLLVTKKQRTNTEV